MTDQEIVTAPAEDTVATAPAAATPEAGAPAEEATIAAARQAAADALARAQEARAAREAAAAALAAARQDHDASTAALATAKQVCLELCPQAQPEYDENGVPTPEYIALDKALHDPHRAQLEEAYARFDETAKALGELSGGRPGPE